jgi:hypothetical protein
MVAALLEDLSVLRRFVFRFLIFIALIFSGSFLAALATAQASPA